MTPTLLFSSSSDRSVHVAKLLFGDFLLMRAIFVGPVTHRLNTYRLNGNAAMPESTQVDLVNRAVNYARDLARRATPEDKANTCATCESGGGGISNGRIFCSLWNVSCSASATCYKFQRRAAPALRDLFPGETPLTGDLYPDLNGKLSGFQGLAMWQGLAALPEWKTYRPAPKTWESFEPTEDDPVKVGDALLWADRTRADGLQRVTPITSVANAEWFTNKLKSREPSANQMTVWRHVEVSQPELKLQTA